MEVRPTRVSCKFTVAVSDTAGLGITNLRGPTVSNVFMHTTAATPSTLPQANPQSGTIVVQLQDNYQQLIDYYASFTSPASGSALKIDNAALTAGHVYTITVVGNATTADWIAAGLPAGVVPAVGANFVCKANLTGNTRTSRVQAPATAGSGIDHIELLQSSSGDINPTPSANQGWGSQFICLCFSGGTLTQPADGTVIHIDMYLTDSGVTIQGE